MERMGTQRLWVCPICGDTIADDTSLSPEYTCDGSHGWGRLHDDTTMIEYVPRRSATGEGENA